MAKRASNISLLVSMLLGCFIAQLIEGARNNMCMQKDKIEM
jgi:hypothetical protein